MAQSVADLRGGRTCFSAPQNTVKGPTLGTNTMAMPKMDSIIFGGDANTVVDIDYTINREELMDANTYYTPRRLRFLINSQGITRLKFRLLKPNAFSTKEFMCEKEYNLFHRAVEVKAPFSGLYQYKANPPTNIFDPSPRLKTWFSQSHIYSDTDTDNSTAYVSSMYGVNHNTTSDGTMALGFGTRSNSAIQTGSKENAFMKFYYRGQTIQTTTSTKPSNTRYYKFDLGSENTFLYNLNADFDIPLTKCTDEVINMDPNEYAKDPMISMPHYKPVFWEVKTDLYNEESLNGPNGVEVPTLFVYLKMNTKVPNENIEFNVNTFNDAIQATTDSGIVLWELNVAKTDTHGNVIYGPNGPELEMKTNTYYTKNKSPALDTDNYGVTVEKTPNGYYWKYAYNPVTGSVYYPQ